MRTGLSPAISAFARSTTRKMTASDGLRDIIYVYGGRLRVISVPPSLRGMQLRDRIAAELLIQPVKRVKLIVLKRPDGYWANQDDATTVPGHELRYPQIITYVLPDTGEDDMVHLRVELEW
jgi:hypothetical protein